MRQYYEFTNVDTDRYQIGGGQQLGRHRAAHQRALRIVVGDAAHDAFGDGVRGRKHRQIDLQHRAKHVVMAMQRGARLPCDGHSPT